jgi:molybdenum cofactor guanylyltransferase
MPPFSAVLLVAGRSTRMGRDKALLEIEGVPLWQRQRDVLLRVGAAELFLSARPEQAWARDAGGFDALLHDALPGCGPLAGITAGLERAAHAHVAVLAIDLPRMTAVWFERLGHACGPGVGAVGRRTDGHETFFEPLAAIYPVEMKWRAWESLAAHRYALQPLLRSAVEEGLLRAVEIAETEAGWFTNWNAADDLPPGTRP